MTQKQGLIRRSIRLAHEFGNTYGVPTYAAKERGTEKVDVGQRPGNGSAVGGGNPQGSSVAGEGQPIQQETTGNGEGHQGA